MLNAAFLGVKHLVLGVETLQSLKNAPSPVPAVLAQAG